MLIVIVLVLAWSWFGYVTWRDRRQTDGRGVSTISTFSNRLTVLERSAPVERRIVAVGAPEADDWVEPEPELSTERLRLLASGAPLDSLRAPVTAPGGRTMTLSEAQQRRRQMVIGLGAALVLTLPLGLFLGGMFFQLAFLVLCASVAYGGLLARARRVEIERAIKVRTIDRVNARREAYQAPAPGEAYGDEPYGGDVDDYGFGYADEPRVGYAN